MSNAPRQPSRRSSGGGPTLELQVDALAFTGEGVARLPGGDAVFLPGTLPGERVRARVGDGRPRRAVVLERLASSPERVEPPCPNAARCGGCDWMHLAQPARAVALSAGVVRLLEGQLGRLGVAVPEPGFHTPSAELGYRTRARLHASANGRHVRVGYRPARSHELLAVDACPVMAPELAALLGLLPTLLAGSRGEGEATVALGRDRRPVVELRWSGTLADTYFAGLERAVLAGALAGARSWLSGAREPLVAGDPRPVVRGVDGRDLVVGAGGFSQASDEAGAALARKVAELATGASKAIELFAGSGTLTIALAPVVGALTAIERDEPAVEALRHNVQARGLDVKVRLADADAVALPKVDLVVLDPPRGGAAGAARAIAESRPKRVIYVSCNAATLARDLALLAEARYRPTSLDLYDVFPGTSHVEAIAALAR